MNWRRGILLAGIHLAIAVPLIVMDEVQHEASTREHYASLASQPAKSDSGATSLDDEEADVAFDPCKVFFDYSTRHQVEQSLEPFAVALSGWQQVCPPRWSIARRLKIHYDWLQAPSTIPARREVGLAFGLLIAAQWILLGGFPLTRPRRWWAEPGAFITCCAVASFGLVLIRPIEELARFPITLAALAWFWWFGLLLWTVARLGWRLITRRRAAAKS
jgi:hypothetical protein